MDYPIIDIPFRSNGVHIGEEFVSLNYLKEETKWELTQIESVSYDIETGTMLVSGRAKRL